MAVCFFAAILIVLPIAARGGDVSNEVTLQNPLKSEYSTIPCLFKAILQIAAEIGAVFVVLGIIYSGFLFVTARGNEEYLGVAKKAITYTVIGAILVLGAWAFSVGVANTINTITSGTNNVQINCP